ncbi:MAG: hypothetical protein ABIA75_00225 [Candidatus Neomarinimicrobiota bacterium]
MKLLLIFGLTSILWAQTDQRPCEDCHSPEGWLPLAEVPTFNHDETVFPLEGRHRLARCTQCHDGNVDELHDFARLSPECRDCHLDIHQGDFNGDCAVCHSPATWEMSGWRRNHDLTLFPLSGTHQVTPCRDCHSQDFYTLRGNLTTECRTCHQTDFQQALAGGHPQNDDCLICHNTRHWSPVDMSNHDLLFPIYSGAHNGKWNSCEVECHVYAPDYTRFECGLNGVCHAHRQSAMDSKHRGEARNYVYLSSACFDCHLRGKSD